MYYTDLILSEVLMVADMVAQISSSKIVHEEIQLDLILERAVQVDQKGTLHFGEYFPFINYCGQIPFFYQTA